ncbi:MAG TPA: PilZ domain-containing protein [Candidatus Dormibacteraeota bacterium]|nr:PilZ domain-containing protein [Candidatus Dormibacteraeota bacterium]
MHSFAEQATHKTRRHPRISLPKGMSIAWHGGDLQLFSRVKTMGMGGLFISAANPPPVGTKLRLAFEVPGGNVGAEAIVRNIIPGEGMGVEFTKMDLKDRVLFEKLLKRLLQ